MDVYSSVEGMYKSGLYASYVEIFPFILSHNFTQVQLINTVLYQVDSNYNYLSL